MAHRIVAIVFYHSIDLFLQIKIGGWIKDSRMYGRQLACLVPAVTLIRELCQYMVKGNLSTPFRNLNLEENDYKCRIYYRKPDLIMVVVDHISRVHFIRKADQTL